MNIDEQRRAFEKYELSKKPEGNPKLMFQRFEVEDLGTDEQSYVGKYYNSFMEEKWELWLASANREGYKLVPVKATDSQWAAGIDAYTQAMYGQDILSASAFFDIYEAMVGAAE